MCGAGTPDQATLMGSMPSVNGAAGASFDATINPPPINIQADPSETARNGLLTQASGAITGAVGAFSKASQAQQASKYNMDLANQNMLNDARVGDSQAQKLYQQTSQLKGTQRASLAARGLDLGSGSPLDILTSTDVMGATDQATLKQNTRQNIAADQAKADFYRRQASASNPFIASGTSLVTGASKVADKWYDDKKAGLWG